MQAEKPEFARILERKNFVEGKLQTATDGPLDVCEENTQPGEITTQNDQRK